MKKDVALQLLLSPTLRASKLNSFLPVSSRFIRGMGVDVTGKVELMGKRRDSIFPFNENRIRSVPSFERSAV